MIGSNDDDDAEQARWQLERVVGEATVPKHPFGPYSGIVQAYVDLPDVTSVMDPRSINGLVQSLCRDGQLASSWEGKPIPWRRGLKSLCSPSLPGTLGQAAEDQRDVMVSLFGRWSDLETDPETPPMYQDERRSTLYDLQQADLNPGLPINRRAFLSSAYVNKVLKPYAQAVYACRQHFWRRLKAGHVAGAWLCFQPTTHGSYTLLPPGTGFDGQGGYSINRETYLAGFGCHENELGSQNYPHAPPYTGQEDWMFVGVDEEVMETASKMTSKPGRRKGSGLNDDRYVEEGLKLIRDGKVSNPFAAAKLIVDKYEEQLCSRTSDASAVERIRRKIQASLPANGTPQ